MQLRQIQPTATPGQLDLFEATACRNADNPALMQAIDQINQRFPRGIAVAGTGFDKAWQSKAERISRRYTTDLGGISDG